MPAVRILFAVASLLLGGVLYVGWAVSPGAYGGQSIRDVDASAEALRAERLAAREKALLNHIAACNVVREELIAGRLTLRAAAAALADESTRRPPGARLRFDLFPGRDDEERCWRSTVTWVENMLEGDPRGPAAVARLRAELADLLAARGD